MNHDSQCVTYYLSIFREHTVRGTAPLTTHCKHEHQISNIKYQIPGSCNVVRLEWSWVRLPNSPPHTTTYRTSQNTHHHAHSSTGHIPFASLLSVTPCLANILCSPFFFFSPLCCAELHCLTSCPHAHCHAHAHTVEGASTNKRSFSCLCGRALNSYAHTLFWAHHCKYMHLDPHLDAFLLLVQPSQPLITP